MKKKNRCHVKSNGISLLSKIIVHSRYGRFLNFNEILLRFVRIRIRKDVSLLFSKLSKNTVVQNYWTFCLRMMMERKRCAVALDYKRFLKNFFSVFHLFFEETNFF